ncbi:arginine--tRNA ligase [Erysipelothrix rhusiopathiae]|uniref:Arginine--tRNA ligase n=1 Tax=Erysipelothrix rhusiopathiae ATCC 19414 TaxID=525280 RepID=E7FWN1_ERYRH|nr:arginine--tRNA ligase [Erysipelothrix rhusiopathiae]EFY08757.1 arginine--tRNA ligase [Erysipelothrix rhusiopathiae ATCC 19414]MDE8255981.1 arginine--tRNA ligase [Erysipelothrix rhusiopathiae]MDV7680316.1 arginine--tRNA ligase [Erysipelothrix rhusiopathiae]RNM30880.1 arginine--tRNA ligase [Erysipelothrix rhusiopathiae]VEH83257.1 Arginine--tRNA ligase [Erysipelothrix rhusiopathiae]
MNKIETKLVGHIEDIILDAFGIEKEDGLVMLEIPNNPEMGDYSTNIAMRLTKRVGKNPREIAGVIVEKLEDNEMVESISVAGPGFINFVMKPAVLGSVVNDVIEAGKDYGRSNAGEGIRLLNEYVSANPTGQLHVGHARGAAWGDSLSRIMSFAGYDVLREYYINDLGNQILMLSHSLYARYKQAFGMEAPLPEDGYHGPDIIEIANDVKETEGDKWLSAPEEEWVPYFKELGIKLELERIKEDLNTFGVEMDSWVSEKWLYDDGRVEESLEALKAKGVTFEEDGALWLRSTDFGDDKDRVLIKSDGSYTYLVPDIANHIYKLERGYTHLLNLWGGDHHGYIVRMQAALEALGHPNVLDVDIIQMVRLVDEGVEVKMSKRTGNALGLVELVDDIGVDATRYFFVSRALATPLDFDLGLARKKSNDNPVFYVQYAHARICSILRQAGEVPHVDVIDQLTNPKEIALLKEINEFSSVVADAAKKREVHKIANYVQDLASSFHSFYGEVKVMDPSNPELQAQRLNLLVAVKITLSNALNLIGVNAPEQM